MQAQPQAAFGEAFSQGQAAITATVEEAVKSASGGAALQAIQTLIEQASLHSNARYVEIAAMLVKRYAAVLGPGQADALTQAAFSLSRRFNAGATHIAGIQRANRSPGALVLKA